MGMPLMFSYRATNEVEMILPAEIFAWFVVIGGCPLSLAEHRSLRPATPLNHFIRALSTEPEARAAQVDI
jgi:hypothetical protein